MKIRLKNRIVMHKSPKVETGIVYTDWQIENLGTVWDAEPIEGAFQEAPKYAYKFEEFDMEKRYGKNE